MSARDMRGGTTGPGPASVGGSRREFASVLRIAPYLWPKGAPELKLRVLLALFCLILAKGINVGVPLLYKRAVDMLTPGPAKLIAVPIAMVILYGVARVSAQAFGELRDGVFAKVAQRAVRQIALRTFRHLHGLSLRFHLERQTGGLSRAIERGIRGMDFLLSYMLFSAIPTVVEIALVGGILWRFYDWDFAAATLLTVFVYVAFTFAITDWRVKFRREMNDRDSEANTKAIDSLINFETVKYFANEDHEARRFDKALQAYEKAAVKSQTTLSALNVGQGVIISIGLVVVMLMAGYGVAQGRMTVGDFVMVNAYLVQLYMPLNFLGVGYRNIKQSLIDLETMFRLLDVKPEVTDRSDARALIAGSGEIVFDRVSFHYDPRRPILEDVSFRVAPGGTLAIVGPSGAGKSTIARLLFRFYDVTQGCIQIDGQDLRDVTQDSLRRAIGVVPQDTVLFNDTIDYNIAYGRPGSDRAEVEEAARLAHIHDFIAKLPDGYKTSVGERGLKLSGGEKQRVAIARVVLKAPRILIFDEATSALDTKTEREIQYNLEEVSRDRTTLMIAHRLSTVIHADEILVLDQGRVAERGSHAGLLAQDGIYAAMWARQQDAARAAELAAVAD